MLEIKVVEKIKTPILCSITFFPLISRRISDNVIKYGNAAQKICDLHAG